MDKESQTNPISKTYKSLPIVVPIILGVITIVAIVLICTAIYREGKVRVPFNLEYVANRPLDEVYQKLKSAGFVNIKLDKETSGTFDDGKVISVFIDHEVNYNSSWFVDPDVEVIIVYAHYE